VDTRDADPAADCWCRLESEGGMVRRVHVMHPNGEILSSYPPETFAPDLLARMRIGQIRGRVHAGAVKAEQVIELIDSAGHVVFADRIPHKTIP
jgi:hypothetical protein